MAVFRSGETKNIYMWTLKKHLNVLQNISKYIFILKNEHKQQTISQKDGSRV